MIKNILKGIAAPVAKVFEKREERKVAIAKFRAAVQQAKVSGETKLNLKDREWELVSKQLEAGTWKDELVTIVFVAPIAMISLGVLGDAFGHPQILDAGIRAMDALNSHLPDYGKMTLAVVYAAIGFKVLKR